MKANRKGFTITELVIVIVVIAILAAVLIPTFASLINKANLSADQQAVRQMNTILKSDEAINGKPETVDGAVEILIANGYSDFNTYYANSILGWIAADNVVVLVAMDDGVGTVVYPEDYKDTDAEYVRINPAAESLEDALAALQAGNGTTVFLAKDIEAKTADDFHFTSNGQYGLNLGGKTVVTNVPNESKGYQDGIVVADTAKTTISDGVIEGGTEIEQVLAVYDAGVLTIEDSVITGGTQIAVLAEAGGTAAITGTKVMGAPGTNPLQAYGGTMVLDNVTAVQSGDHDKDYYNSVIQVVNEIENVDGVWKTTGKLGQLTVNSGTYTGKTTIQISSPGGYVTINGGSFTGTKYVINANATAGYYNQDNNYKCEVTINGGTFTGVFNCAGSAPATITINGGTFNGVAFENLTVEKLQDMVDHGEVTKVGNSFVISAS